MPSEKNEMLKKKNKVYCSFKKRRWYICVLCLNFPAILFPMPWGGQTSHFALHTQACHWLRSANCCICCNKASCGISSYGMIFRYLFFWIILLGINLTWKLRVKFVDVLSIWVQSIIDLNLVYGWEKKLFKEFLDMLPWSSESSFIIQEEV